MAQRRPSGAPAVRAGGADPRCSPLLRLRPRPAARERGRRVRGLRRPCVPKVWEGRTVRLREGGRVVSVRRGICPTCGRVQATWTPQAILDAISAWHREHGLAPSAQDWVNAGHGHPSSHTVRKVYGGFPTAVRCAGFEPRQHARINAWGRGDIVDALFRWRYEHGRLPRAREWDRPPAGFPPRSTVVRRFGSWTAAVEAAGYAPLRRAAA